MKPKGGSIKSKKSPPAATGLKREIKQLRELLEAARLVLSTFELNNVLDAILKSAQEMTHSSTASIALYDSTANELTLYAYRGFGEGEILKRSWQPKEKSLSHRVITSKALTVVSQNTQASFFRDPSRVTDRSKTMACVPLVFEDRVLGILFVDDFSSRAYSIAEQRALEMLANFAGTAIDRVKLHRLTQELARTDGLTGLSNYRFFQEQITLEVIRAQRYRRNLSLIMIDVDDFKGVNDRYGHVVGDFVLKSVAELLRKVVREVDLPVRYGGEEFAIVLPETDSQQAMGVANRVLAMIRQTEPEQLGLSGRKKPVGLSIGIASYPKDAETKDDLIRKADAALYSAKKAGKNRVSAFGGET